MLSFPETQEGIALQRTSLCNLYPALSLRDFFFFKENTLIWEALFFCHGIEDKMLSHGRLRGSEGCLFICLFCLLSHYFNGLTFIWLPRVRASGD